MPPTTSLPIASLSVVMPCFNEVTTVKTVIERVLESPYTAEVVVVDDGSTDGTAESVEGIADPRVRLFRQPTNMGKGAALRRGFSEATAPFVIVQDADLEYDPADYGTVLQPLLDNKADVVFGSRFLGGREHRVLYFWHAIGNRILTTTSNAFTNLNLSDMETCYKAFRREVLESITVEEDRFGVEPEITAKVARGQWRVYEVGVSYGGRTYAEGKKIGWRDGVRAMYCIVRYSPLWDRLTLHPAARAAKLHGPATFDEADAELASTLDSIAEASNYADWIIDLAAPHLGEEILEVGSGHGALTGRLAERGRVTATDMSERCVGVLRERFAGDDRINPELADLVSATEGRVYDSVVLVNVLEHIEDDRAAVRRIAGALRPGGTLVVWVPAFEPLYSEFDRRIGHHRRYRKASMKAVMEGAGLEVVDLRYVNAVGAMAWWLVAKRLGREPTATGNVKLFDRFVPMLRRLEGDRRTPFGQSVFCVARRPPGS
jgi:2-polyprenyl-3-methyl-5-hydroxy-6-metoxy-1,4-benzoquinol methylase